MRDDKTIDKYHGVVGVHIDFGDAHRGRPTAER